VSFNGKASSRGTHSKYVSSIARRFAAEIAAVRNRNKLYTIASEIPAKARERETLIFPDKKGNKSIKSGWFAGDKFAVKERSLPTLTCGEISPTGGSSYVCVCARARARVCMCVCVG